MKQQWILAAATLGFLPVIATAQYPQVPGAVQSVTDARKAAADRASDAAFKAAQPAIEADAARGKPYIPWAKNPGDLPQATIPAFPGAQGGGMHSFGGRGGKVFVVTSLADSGPGTLREACEAGGARVVVFNVSGIIKLHDKIRVRAPYITIAGNTAPGDGVCVAGNTFELDTHDVIIRHMRFRRGEMDVTDRNDSIGGNPIGNIMIDHVSASWGLDENMSMYRHMYSPPDGSKDLKLPTVNITIQNSIFSECLNTFNHAFGSTIGGYNSTFIRNLWACNTGRNPSIGMNGDFGMFNNVVFNWVHRTTDGGDNLSYYNIINNYWKPGPATPDSPVAHRFLKPEAQRGKDKEKTFGKAYVNGNVNEAHPDVTADNWNGGVQLDGAYDANVILPNVRVNEPFPHAPATIVSAKAAYPYVLDHAGATLPKRDPVDERIVKMVRTGEVTYGNGIITDPVQVGGYPAYSGTPYADADKDGMPDDYETAHGLNPNDASDAAKDSNGDGYTNIEKFIYRIDPSKKLDYTKAENNISTTDKPLPGN